jgi:RHS repeat-associated protein
MEKQPMHQSNAKLSHEYYWEKPAANDACASGKLFPGQYYDAETQLHYNYFRDYDPTTGRYIESDPIGLEGGLNTYVYALNNPVRFIDRKGLIVLVLIPPAAEAAATAVAGLGLGLGFCAVTGMCSIPDDDEATQKEARCAEQLEIDNATCKAISKSCRRSKSQAARCFSSAMQRYGNCLSGRDLGPLDTLNN